MKKTIYVLGNKIAENDSLPFILIPYLEKTFPNIQFLHHDPTEEFPKWSSRNIIIIDTVAGIRGVSVFDDMAIWKRSPLKSVHDFDLPLSLGLLRKLGKIKSIKVIGVPGFGNKKEIADQLIKKIKAI